MPTIWEEQLVIARAQLTQVNAAITAVMSGGQSYSLDSGQSRQSVTMSTLGELRKMKADLIAEVVQYEGNVNGVANGGAVIGRPAF